MAKLKKRSKLSQQRHKANQIKETNGGADNSKKESNKSAKALTLLDKIKSSSTSSVNEKLININSILVQCNNDTNTRKIFLKNDLIKITLDLLKQENQYDEILVSCLDLLKHLIIEEDYDLSIYLWRNGIWEILELNFNKAFNSLSHLNDSNVNVISKDLLISYINNLIGILDNLVMELNLETIDNALLSKLTESQLLSKFFQFLNSGVENSTISIALNFLQFIYDLSTISTKFLQNSLINNDEFETIVDNLCKNLSTFDKHPLGKIYIVGIKLQVLELKDDLSSNNLDSLINEIFNILNNMTDLNSKNDEDFQIVDISLDLLTTIIEIKGSLSLQNNSANKDKVFNDKCINQILPFLGKLFEVDFTNNKKLICLNNLMIYLTSNQLISQQLVTDLESLNNNKINNDFESLVSSGTPDLEIVVDYLNFKLNLLEIDPTKLTDNEVNQINSLVGLGMKNVNLENIDNEIDPDIELKIQFITTLLMYLSLLAKAIATVETVKPIVEFIIQYNLVKPIEFYNSKTTKGGLNISKFHTKYKYLVEESINLAINSIFEIFDDDYPYNRPIYHAGNLNGLLNNMLSDYKKIYKNIDKNVNFSLKKQTEETVNNLQRFIEYKKSE